MGLNMFKKKNKCKDCNGDLKRLQDLTKRYSELMWIKSNCRGLNTFECIRNLKVFKNRFNSSYCNVFRDRVNTQLELFVSFVNQMDSDDIDYLIKQLENIKDYRIKSANLNQELESVNKEINQLKAKLKI